MDIHQCPRCELRFVHTSELRHHFEHDHAADPAVFDRYRYRTRAVPPPHRTILLVGNQTLGREGVVDEVAERASDGAHVHVLVPATVPAEQEDPGPAPPDAVGDDAAVSLARWRLRRTIEQLAAAGVDADGAVGPADPYVAVCQVLAGGDIDEILLTTLPSSTSRWLSVDLPGRLRRHTSCPVTVLTPALAPHDSR